MRRSEILRGIAKSKLGMRMSEIAQELQEPKKTEALRFLHQAPLSLEQAMALGKILAGDRILKPDFPFCELPGYVKD